MNRAQTMALTVAGLVVLVAGDLIGYRHGFDAGVKTLAPQSQSGVVSMQYGTGTTTPIATTVGIATILCVIDGDQYRDLLKHIDGRHP